MIGACAPPLGMPFILRNANSVGHRHARSVLQRPMLSTDTSQYNMDRTMIVCKNTRGGSRTLDLWLGSSICSCSFRLVGKSYSVVLGG